MMTFSTSYNGGDEKLCLEVERVKSSLRAFEPKSHGRGFRKSVLDRIKNGGGWSKKNKFRPLPENTISVDTATEDDFPVGLSMQVSHSNAAKAEFLHFEALFRKRAIRGAIFVTQMEFQGKRRNLGTDGQSGWGGTGNRVTYESIKNQMEYYSSFLSVPMVLIGLQTS